MGSGSSKSKPVSRKNSASNPTKQAQNTQNVTAKPTTENQVEPKNKNKVEPKTENKFEPKAETAADVKVVEKEKSVVKPEAEAEIKAIDLPGDVNDIKGTGLNSNIG